MYPYSASIYYWIGKRYEVYDANQKEAEIYFKKSYEKNGSYKSKFKLAVLARKQRRYKDAVDIYKDMIKELKFKKNHQIMTPIEAEYMYKAYYQIAYISSQHMRNRQGDVIWAGRNGVAIRDDEDKVIQKFFKLLYYKKHPAKYMKLNKSRMYVEGLYSMLVGSYADLNERELSQYYRDKLFG